MPPWKHSPVHDPHILRSKAGQKNCPAFSFPLPISVRSYSSLVLRWSALTPARSYASSFSPRLVLTSVRSHPGWFLRRFVLTPVRSYASWFLRRFLRPFLPLRQVRLLRFLSFSAVQRGEHIKMPDQIFVKGLIPHASPNCRWERREY